MKHFVQCCALVIVVLFSVFSTTNSAFAQTNIVRYVDDDATSGGNGQSWSSRYRFPIDAINDAEAHINLNSGNTAAVHIAGGTYYPDRSNAIPAGSTDRTASFRLLQRVTIEGQYLGLAGASGLEDTRDPSVITNFDGDIHDQPDPVDNSFHVVTSLDEFSTNANCVLDGVVVRRGRADDTTPTAHQDKGGGIFIRDGAPTISNCKMFENSVFLFGGGIACLDNETAPPRIFKCLFEENDVISTTGSAFGGGLWCNTQVNVSSSTFYDNHTTSAGLGGGAAFSPDQNATEAKFISCVFIANTAADGGGVGASSTGGGELTLINCLVAGNSAVGGGGGGVCCSGLVLDMVNCTVANGEAFIGGGLKFSEASGDPPLSTIINSVFWGNDASEDEPDIFAAGDLGIANCDIEDPLIGGTNVIHDNPNFNDPNGPDDEANTIDDDFSLACPSPCINTGSNTYVPDDDEVADGDTFESEPTPDALLKDRIIGWPGYPASAVTDMGAYETQLFSPCGTPQPGDTAPLPCTDGRVNIDDFLIVILNWGDCPAGVSFCPGDVAYHWGVVNIDDLLVVIMNWSQQCQSGTYNAGSFSSVEDCEDAASEVYTPHSAEWNDSVTRCINALCAAEILDCD